MIKMIEIILKLSVWNLIGIYEFLYMSLINKTLNCRDTDPSLNVTLVTQPLTKAVTYVNVISLQEGIYVFLYEKRSEKKYRA